MTVQFFYLTQCLLLHYPGKEDKAKSALKYTKKNLKKNIHDFIDRNLKNDYQVLITFGTYIFDTTDY